MLKGKLRGVSTLKGSIQRESIGTGTTDYEKLKNLPSINDVELVGNKTSEELGLANKSDIPVVPTKVSAFENDAGYLKEVPSEYVTEEELTGKGYATTSDVESAVKDKATTGYVDQKVADLVNSAPETLDTLGEVAKAIEENADVVDALNNAIGNKADKTELDDYVKFTDNAKKGFGTVNAGIVAFYPNERFSGMKWYDEGNVTFPFINPAGTTNLSSRTSVDNTPLVPRHINAIVKGALTGDKRIGQGTEGTDAWAVSELTEEEKTQARDVLGIPQIELTQKENGAYKLTVTKG